MQPWLRIVLAILGVGLFALLVMGILNYVRGRSSEQGNTTKKELRVWRTDADSDPFNETFAEFEVKSGYAITYTKQPIETYELNALRSLAAQKGPDIWSIPSDWLADHYDRTTDLPETLLQSLEGYKESKLSEVVRTEYPEGISRLLFDTAGENVIALPSTVDTYRIIYNPDLFARAYQEHSLRVGENADEDSLAAVQRLLGKPADTWSGIVDQVPYLTQRNGSQILRSGFALGTANNIPFAGDILQLLILQNGQEIVNDRRDAALFDIPITSPTKVEVRPGELALQFYTQFSSPTSSAYTWNASMPDAIQAFGEGKVAMLIGLQKTINEIATRYPNLEFEQAPMPQISTGPGSNPKNLITFTAEVITPATPNRAAAQSFLVSYTGSGTTSSIASEQRIYSPLKTYLESAEENDPFAGQILTGIALYKKNRSLFDIGFNQIITDVTQNGLQPSAAITKGAQEINRVLKLPLE